MNQISKRIVNRHIDMIRRDQKGIVFDAKFYEKVLRHASMMSKVLFGTDSRWADINDYIKAAVALNPDISNESIYEALRYVGIWAVEKKK